MKAVLDFAKEYALHSQTLTGTRILIVGMPNVGKSSMLNALRMAGVHRAKAASTGAQPGVTRKIAATGVKIMDRDEAAGTAPLYLIDTPGVFIPFVPNAEAMLKLALCGSVKDTIIAPTTMADYLLYHFNKQKHGKDIYGEYCAPTNDVNEFLESVCMKTGRLGKGGVPDLDASALWIIQRWRQGSMGRFVLDDVTEDGLEKKMAEEVEMSMNQARKQLKHAQKMRVKSRKVEALGSG